MRNINVSLGAVAGAIANGSENERWFIDLEHDRLFLISSLFQTDEEVEKAVDMINSNPENYISLLYLRHEEFLDEVEMYTRTLSDKPVLAKYLQKAVAEKAPRTYIKQLLNREPGQSQDFANFYSERVQERASIWAEKQGIKFIG